MSKNIARPEVKELGLSDKSERREVSAAIVGMELKTFARSKWPLTNDKDRKRRLKVALGFTARRIKSLWEGSESARVHTDETDAIEAMIGHRIGAAAELEEARHEYRDLAQLAASLHALLYGPEADFYRPQVDAIRAALIPPGRGTEAGSGVDGAGNPERESTP
jgi:hypothetical protein